jgi:hypothetical protein
MRLEFVHSFVFILLTSVLVVAGASVDFIMVFMFPLNKLMLSPKRGTDVFYFILICL